MGKFITLTVEHNGQPTLVNIDRIETVHRDYTLKTETTYVELGEDSLAVQESVESVANLIRRAEEPGFEKIIHCKDCKYCEHWYWDKGRCFLWVKDGIDVFEDGFCNYGKRKEEGRQ